MADEELDTKAVAEEPQHDPTKAEKRATAEATSIASGVGSGKTMKVKVYAPFKVYFDGPATSISAINDTGPFDILPQHHNFMTLLNAGDIIVRGERGEERIQIERGIMHIKADEVIVFLDV